MKYFKKYHSKHLWAATEILLLPNFIATFFPLFVVRDRLLATVRMGCHCMAIGLGT